MKSFWMLAAAGAVALGFSAANAQTMTLAGAEVMLTEIPGATDCSKPGDAPGIPDGATSEGQTMMVAIGAIQDHIATIEEYQDCLNAAAQALGTANLTAEQDQAVTIVYDARAAQIEELGEKINEQIRAFNVANPDD